jgi:integrase
MTGPSPGLLGAEAGLRQGETIALEWGDVDLVAGLLTVRRSSWKGNFRDGTIWDGRRNAQSSKLHPEHQRRSGRQEPGLRGWPSS